MSDSNQYLLDKIDRLVDVISANTALLNTYIERHDHVQKDVAKIDIRVKEIGLKVQSHSETLVKHSGTHQDVTKVKNSLIGGIVAIILGLTSGLVYVGTGG
jgi:hypothetical protein